MENLFTNLSTFISAGLTPMLTDLVNWLMGDGLFLGLVVIVLPLLGRIVSIFKKISGK